MLLPSYGGSPAVWNTALVFFQTALLAGYLYAYVLSRRLPLRTQVLWHVPVLIVPILLLPPTVAAATAADPGRWPVPWVFVALTAAVGAPFFVLATNSSLIQHWYGASGQRDAHDPYWLYGASNLGSLLALLSYPFLIEPLIDSSVQAAIWSWGYLIFVALTGLVAFRTYRLGQAETTWPPMGASATGEAASLQADTSTTGVGCPASTVSRSDRLVWVARAAVASSLLLSVTMRITTDVAPVPLFWIAPLALYLITFILAFARTFRIPRLPVAAAALLGISASLGLAILPRVWPLKLVLVVSFWTLLSGALLCHLDLARQRPNLRHLTEFYLWIALGGVIGGALNAIVAPLIFDSVAEYPITLAALALLLTLKPQRGGGLQAYRPQRVLAIAGMLALILPAQYSLLGANPLLLWVAPSVAAIMVGLVVSKRNGLFAVMIAIIAVQLANGAPFAGTLEQERSFFGVTRITSDDQLVVMFNGTTVHGAQPLDPSLRDKPVTYYYPSGPFGALLQGASDSAHIGVIGLGIGSLAGYGKAGQRIDFHEIDPTVVRLARSHFTYLSGSQAETSVVLGDGRLTISNVPDGTYDILVVDAFASDAIPVHLLTIEALESYLSKVTEDGLVVVHISNRHLDLLRVFRGFSDYTGRPVAYSSYEPTEIERREYAYPTLAVAIAPSAEGLRELFDLPGWRPLPQDVPSVLWTDRFSSIVRVLR